MQTNHSDIFHEFPNYFNELDEVKKIRNTIAHNEVQYEADPAGENASLILHHPRIKRQKKLRENEMLDIMEKANKCAEVTGKILKSIGKTKGLRF